MSSIYLAQRTDRQIVKRIIPQNGSYAFDGTKFGIYQQIRDDEHGFAFPGSIVEIDQVFYVCDSQNQRILKLTDELAYEDELDVSAIGEPHAMFYDEDVTGDLYVVGVRDYRYITIAQISSSSFSITKSNDDIGFSKLKRPFGFSRGFNEDDFIISGFASLYRVQETEIDFSNVATISITGETGASFRGHFKHSNGFLYVIAQRPNMAKIVKVNEAYRNDGDTGLISKECTHLGAGLEETMLVYDNAGQRILRFDGDLNFSEVVYADSGDTINRDAFDVSGFVESSGVIVEPFIIQDDVDSSLPTWDTTANPDDPIVQNVVELS